MFFLYLVHPSLIISCVSCADYILYLVPYILYLNYIFCILYLVLILCGVPFK